MRRPTALLLVVASLAALASVSACGGIPSSGPVRVSDATAPAPRDPFIRVLARPPRAGATPTEIVAGFLTASGSFEDDHAVARRYLTPAASRRWVPQARVSVYDSATGYDLLNAGVTAVRMVAPRAAGEISARGAFRQPVAGSDLRAAFALSRVEGQWRISEPPQGLILGTADVDRAYRALNLYFLDLAGGVLVPDPLVVPAQQPGAATTLTRQLLAGPTAWLAPAVRTAFPEGTRLAVDAVPVDQGIARVDLTGAIVGTSGADRAAFVAQLTYTLAQLADVDGVRITVNGVPFAVPGIGSVSRVSDWVRFDPDAAPSDASTYALDRGHLAVIQTSALAVPGYFGQVATMTQGAVALDGALVAGALRESGRSTVRVGPAGAATAPALYRGTSISTMSFDRLNSVWFADRTRSGSTVWVARTDRGAIRVRVEGAPRGQIRALRVARDGARVAMIVAPSADAPGTLYLGRIERASGVPVVAGLRRVESALTGALDVSWSSATTLLVVARQRDEPFQAYTVGIDGDSLFASGLVPSIATVAACPDRPLLAGTTDARIFLDSGNGWRIYVTGDVPIYPG